MAVSANRLELLQIADAVAREKNIEKNVVLEAMEERGVVVTTTVFNSYLKVLAKGAERGIVGAKEAISVRERMTRLKVHVAHTSQ